MYASNATRLRTSVWLCSSTRRRSTVMRRAMRVDPESINEVPGNAPVRNLILGLTDRYRARSAESFDDTDTLFMLATMHYLAGETVLANAPLERGLDRGDVDPSVQNLKSILNEALQREDGVDEPLMMQPPVATPPAFAPTTSSSEVLY